MTTQAQQTPIAICFLLDRSGSMSSIRQATIDGINTFVKAQKGSGIPTTFSLTLFDQDGGGLSLEHVFEDKAISDIQELENFVPRGGTPLLDAMKATVKWFEGKVSGRPDRVLFVTQTDGEENASKDTSFEDLKGIVRAKTDQGWEFIYIGANQDAFKVGAQMGIARGNTTSYEATAVGTRTAYQATTMSTQAYASAGSSYQKGTFFSGTPQAGAVLLPDQDAPKPQPHVPPQTIPAQQSGVTFGKSSVNGNESGGVSWKK